MPAFKPGTLVEFCSPASHRVVSPKDLSVKSVRVPAGHEGYICTGEVLPGNVAVETYIDVPGEGKFDVVVAAPLGLLAEIRYELGDSNIGLKHYRGMTIKVNLSED